MVKQDINEDDVSWEMIQDIISDREAMSWLPYVFMCVYGTAGSRVYSSSSISL